MAGVFLFLCFVGTLTLPKETAKKQRIFVDSWRFLAEGRPSQMNKETSINIPAAMHDMATKLAKERYMSFSGFVRSLIAAEIAASSAKPATRKGGAK
jgi:hypothetical protein